jgi:putative flippase GtrA
MSDGGLGGGYPNLAMRLHHAARRPQNWIQLVKFGVVGGSGYVINLIVFAVLVSGLGVYHVAAAVGAFLVALGNNFFWNRHWTFGPGEGMAHHQAIRFTVVSVGALLINLAALEVLVSSMGMNELAAQAIAVAFAMPFNFVGNKLWTFS